MKKEKALSENVYKGRFYRVVDVAEAVKKLKDIKMHKFVDRFGNFKDWEFEEEFDKIMGNFNHSIVATAKGFTDSNGNFHVEKVTENTHACEENK